MARKPTPIWQPLSQMSFVNSLLQEGVDSADEMYASLKAAEHRPYVLDDVTINRVIKLYSEQLEDHWLYEEQLARWRQESPTPEQNREIDRMEREVVTLKETLTEILDLAQEFKGGTIDTILGKSDMEMGLEFLLGAMPPPPRRPPPPPASLPTLTVNGHFMHAFLDAQTPCCALSMVEVEGEPCGLVALRPDRPIPPHVTDLGFRFGHQVMGGADYEVVHFGFEFYGFGTYHALVNPANPLVMKVIDRMLDTGDYFFFALDSDQSLTAFRSEIGEQSLIYLKAFQARLQKSQTTEEQYRNAVRLFSKQPDPPGTMLHWVAHETEAYLDLTSNRFDITPRTS